MSSDKALLPLGALMLAASMGAAAQGSAPETTMSTVTVKETAEIQGKDTLLLKKTTVGKGKQDIKDIPQSVTVFTEKLMADRNQDDFREVLPPRSAFCVRSVYRSHKKSPHIEGLSCARSIHLAFYLLCSVCPLFRCQLSLIRRYAGYRLGIPCHADISPRHCHHGIRFPAS